MNKPLLNQVVQIGIVVNDAKATAGRYCDLLGLSDWHFNQVDTTKGKGANFRKGKQSIAAKALIAWTSLGDVELELIEPQDDTSVYAEFLRERGQGIHHVMFSTPDYDTCREQLEANGIDVLGSGDLQETRFTLFDTQADLGVICEIAQGGALVPDKSWLAP